MAQNLDELVKVLELLGETKGAMPMPKSLGKGRPSGWQKGVERMLEEYDKAAANAVANVEIPRGLQTASGGAVEASRYGAPSTTVLPRAKAPKTPAPDWILAEAVEIPPKLNGGMFDELLSKASDKVKAKGFGSIMPTAAELEGLAANAMPDGAGVGMGGIGKLAKRAIPSLEQLLGKMKPVLDMSKLGSMDKAIAKEANIAAKEAANVAAKKAAADALSQGLEKVGKEAAEKAAKEAVVKTGSKLGKLGKWGAGLGAAGLLGAYLMGNDGEGLEQEQTAGGQAQPSGPSMQDMLMAQLMNGGSRSSELDKALEAMASQIRINAANAERQNRVASGIANASQRVSDRL